MQRIIEVTVAPDGATTVQTKGYVGQDCQAASRFLELALGVPTSDRKTDEFFQTQPEQQTVRQ